jgi:hypothetical protein
VKFPYIAFVGFGRVGKDTAAEPLIAAGYNRVAFGDIIKRHLDPVIRKYFGFSAFTEATEEKQKIRRTLESYGEDAYDVIFSEFFDNLPVTAVNVRLCRLREATEWVRRGGILVRVFRPGVGPETEWSARVNKDLEDSGLIHSTVINDGSVEELQLKIINRYL